MTITHLKSQHSTLDRVIKQINRHCGAGTVVRLGEAPQLTVETFSSGAAELDRILGGGYPRGRIVEIFGSEASGKTTLALHAIAEVQKLGGTAMFIDMEHALDPAYAQAIGVDINQLLVSQPSSGEIALEIAERLLACEFVQLIVIDSVAALTPELELNAAMGEYQAGLHSSLMSKALRRWVNKQNSLAKAGCTMIFLNQLRHQLGMCYDNPEITTGGFALQFYASIRLDLRRIQTLQRHGEAYGIQVRVKVIKNKIAPPFRSAEIDLIFGKGITPLARTSGSQIGP